MPSQYQHLRSETPGAIPSPSLMLSGQIAVNIADRKFYTKTLAGNIVELSPSGQVIVDFGNAGNEPESVSVTVLDSSISANSKIQAFVSGPSSGRDFDEMEFVDLKAYVGNIVAGVSFDIIVRNDNGGAHGQFIVNYTR